MGEGLKEGRKCTSRSVCLEICLVSVNMKKFEFWKTMSGVMAMEKSTERKMGSEVENTFKKCNPKIINTINK